LPIGDACVRRPYTRPVSPLDLPFANGERGAEPPLKVTRGQIEIVRAPKQQDIPDGYSESGISAKPITLTVSLAAIILFALSRLLT
jgi:hypothetical protein